ncbi:hypothetical protein HNR23_002129 [Nocardiopsis mwathae]|uniref:Uncharacterized protein n=1 Tax=Nocardiopsis mwathae TaxID=1472723 RepID=A0A7X0D6G1_9ACTN|nr:hypothetical protein [Nocardiopsis mwathae]
MVPVGAVHRKGPYNTPHNSTGPDRRYHAGETPDRGADGAILPSNLSGTRDRVEEATLERQALLPPAPRTARSRVTEGETT